MGRMGRMGRVVGAVGTCLVCLACAPARVRVHVEAYLPARPLPLGRRSCSSRNGSGAGGVRCSLSPLTNDMASKLLPRAASRDQWSWYWGDGIRKAGKVYESAAVGFLGVWACYFMSFFVGVPITTLVGAVFAFYWLLGPIFKITSKNGALRAPQGSFAALFSARVISAKRVKSSSAGVKEAWFRLVVEDEDGRALTFRVPPAPAYDRISNDMRVEAVLISTDAQFERIMGVSDAYVPAADAWVGSYPYLNKVRFRRYLAEKYGYSRRRPTVSATRSRRRPGGRGLKASGGATWSSGRGGGSFPRSRRDTGDGTTTAVRSTTTLEKDTL